MPPNVDDGEGHTWKRQRAKILKQRHEMAISSALAGDLTTTAGTKTLPKPAALTATSNND